MTVEQMIAEMSRKPSAHTLAEYTAELLTDVASDPRLALQVGTDIARINAAYFDALEG